MTDAPDFALRCVWTGEALVPRGASLREAREMWGAGEMINVTGAMERSGASHRHYFVEIAEMWGSLPERLHVMPYAVNPEAFRKHALIISGYADVETVLVGTKAGAERVAAAIRRLPGEYRITQVHEGAVTILTPQSQSYRAMGKKLFQKSKDDVLGWCSAVLRGDAA